MLLLLSLLILLQRFAESAMDQSAYHEFKEAVGVLELSSITANRTSDTAISLQLSGGNRHVTDILWRFDAWKIEICRTRAYLRNVPDDHHRTWRIYKDHTSIRIFCNSVLVYELGSSAACSFNVTVTTFRFYLGETATKSHRMIPCKYVNKISRNVSSFLTLIYL